MTRPLVLLAVLVVLHLGAQRLLLGHVVPALLVLPVLAVAAFEAADRAATRRRQQGVESHGQPRGEPHGHRSQP